MRLIVSIVILLNLSFGSGQSLPAKDKKTITSNKVELTNAVEPKASIDIQKLIVNARFDYVMESEEFIKTIEDTKDILLNYRNKGISNKYVQNIKNIEKNLIKANTALLELVTNSEKENFENIFLDDALLIRMAQLYFDKATFNFSNNLNDMMASYNKEVQRYNKGLRKDYPELPRPDYSDSIRLSRRLLKSFPRSPFADRAEYLISYIYEEKGQFDKAKAVYKYFIKKYPYSNYIDEVRWRYAELNFDIGNFKEAKDNYLYLSKKIGSRFEFKALYKLGAALYQKKLYKLSGKLFERLSQRLDSSSLSGRDVKTLKDESLEYIGLLMQKGVVFRLSSNKKAKAVAKVSEVLERNNKFKLSRSLLKKYVKDNPLSSETPNFYDKIIKSYVLDGKNIKAHKVREQFIASYNKESIWWKKNKKNHWAIFSAQDTLEDNILDVARFYYKKSIKIERNKSISRDKAERFYKVFIRDFSASDLVPVARYELGQLYYDFNKYALAKEFFYGAIENKSADEQILDDASYAYLIAELKNNHIPLENAFKIKASKMGTAFSNKDAVFLDAGEVLLKYSKNNRRRSKVLLRMGQIYFNYGKLEEAEKYIEQIIRKEKVGGAILLNALNLSAEVNNRLGNYEILQKRNRQLLMASQKQNTSDKKVSTLYSNKVLNDAISLINSGKIVQGKEQLATILKVSKNKELKKEALYSYASILSEEGSLKKSNELLEEHLNLSTDATYYLQAQNYSKAFDFTNSNKVLFSLLKRFKNTKIKNDIYYNLYSNYFSMKNYKESAKYLDIFADRSKNELIYFDVADLYIEAEMEKLLNKSLSRIKSKNVSTQIRKHFYKARLNWKLTKFKKLSQSCKKIQSLIDKVSKVDFYGARANTYCKIWYLSLQLNQKKTIQVNEDLLSQIALYIKPKDGVNFLLSYSKSLTDDEEKKSILNYAWDYVGGRINSVESFKLYGEIKKEIQIQDLNRMLNWNNFKHELFEFPDNNKLTEVYSQCRSYEFTWCIRELTKNYDLNRNPSTLQALVKAHFMAGNDKIAIEYLEELGEITEWPDDLRYSVTILGLNTLKKKFSAPERKTKNASWKHDVYFSILLIDEKNSEKALKYLVNAIYKNASTSLPYIFMAHYFKKRKKFSEISLSFLKAHSNLKNENFRASISSYMNNFDPKEYEINPGIAYLFPLNGLKTPKELNLSDVQREEVKLIDQRKRGLSSKSELKAKNSQIQYLIDNKKRNGWLGL